MSGPQFFQTKMGQRFFEETMPKLVGELALLNPSLRAIADALQALHARPADPDVTAAAEESLTPTSASPSLDDVDVTALFARIAEQHLGIATLEERQQDSLDFHEVNVRSVIVALHTVYDAGFAAGIRHCPH